MIDGEVTSYFEWLGAGRYRPDPRSGAMHGGELPVREFLYGSDGKNVYVRLDADRQSSFGVEFENGPVQVQVVTGRITEICAPRAGERFRVTVARDGLPPATVPAEGWIELF